MDEEDESDQALFERIYKEKQLRFKLIAYCQEE